MKIDGKGDLGRSRKISPKIIFLILKGNNFFGQVAVSKSKLKLLWTSLVHLTTCFACVQKRGQANSLAYP